MECRQRSSTEQRAHLAEIEKIVTRWHDGEIGIDEKRELIGRENAFYHGQRARGRTGTVITVAPGGHAAHSQPAEEQQHFWWQDS